MTQKRQNPKQVYAETLRNIAKEIRATIDKRLPYQAHPIYITAADLAEIFENEAKRLTL